MPDSWPLSFLRSTKDHSTTVVSSLVIGLLVIGLSQLGQWYKDIVITISESVPPTGSQSMVMALYDYAL